MAAQVSASIASFLTASKPSSALFPARTSQAIGIVSGVLTQVTSVYLADKILITISQDGKLCHWVHVPLDIQDPHESGRRTRACEDGSELLPMHHLTARTLLGGSVSERDTLGQLYATQIASAIATKDPSEKRLLLLGMAFRDIKLTSQGYMHVLDLVLQCL